MLFRRLCIDRLVAPGESCRRFRKAARSLFYTPGHPRLRALFHHAERNFAGRCVGPGLLQPLVINNVGIGLVRRRRLNQDLSIPGASCRWQAFSSAVRKGKSSSQLSEASLAVMIRGWRVWPTFSVTSSSS